LKRVDRANGGYLAKIDGTSSDDFTLDLAMDEKLAAEIASRVLAVSQRCESSLGPVKANESLGIVQVYGRLVADFMGHAYTNVLAPIWKVHPALEPPDMKEPYVEPTPSLTEESKAALKQFAVEARKVLDFTKASVSENEAKRLFAYGGLTELEDSLQKIEQFLAHPRFRDADGRDDNPV
jgi:hypothetical protein